MAGELILVADDDADILRFVELNLRLEGYEVVVANDGDEALRLASERTPALAILDVMMPKIDGYEVCQRLRSQGPTASMCVIMLTAKTMSADKVLGLTAGADDYISKPFDPMELVARVRSTLRRAQEMRALSPLTGLPGNVQIEEDMRRRVEAGESIGVLWLDLDNFKAYNDRYGFIAGDRAINYLAGVMREVAAEHHDVFLGHVGGDDFVAVVPAQASQIIGERLIARFDEGVTALYDDEDARRGVIVVHDRLGAEREFPLLSLSIGAATNESRAVTDHRELVSVASEMKSHAKRKPGSVFEIDRRRGDEPGS